MHRLPHLFQRCSFLFIAVIALAAGPAFGLATPDSRPARIKPTIAAEDCTSLECHASLLTRKVMHGPVAVKMCLECHKYEDVTQHRFQRLAAPNQGCNRCHDLKPKSVVHAPVHDGRCTDCHDPHGSDYTKMLVADPSKGLCQKCHKQEEVSSRKFPHAPFAAGTCGVCHESHSASQPRLLKQPLSTLCTSCHKDEVPKPGEAFSIHAPARDDCVTCHDPHASNAKNDLKQALPELCLSCHKNTKETLTQATVKHAANTQDNTCDNCHTPHFSKFSKLQKQSQPQECLNCHDKELKAVDGHAITNMAALLKDNPEHHGPIRLGACTACHQPHGGTREKLLIASYPPEFYAAFNEDIYKLCFTCHLADLVLKKEDAPTGFADGRKNLHWVHVDQEKGRTCRACHEVHASRQPFHIRDSVPFGPNGWQMSINFRQTPTGGVCSAGCHGEKSYDHGNRPRSIPVVALTPKAQALTRPAPASMPAADMAVTAGRPAFPVAPPPLTPGIFPCTTCHDPNQAVNNQKRDMHKPHENIRLNHDQEHRWCLDCHNAQNRDVLRSAAGEPIPFSESYLLCGQCHGLQYRDWTAGLHGKRTGEWDGRKDYLLCVNCHDPHSPKFKSLKPLPPPVTPDKAK